MREGRARLVRLYAEMLTSPAGATFVSFTPDSIPLQWDTMVERSVPVQPTLVGTLPSRSRVEHIEVDPPHVRVRGASLYIDPMASVHTEPVDVSNLAPGRYERRIPLETPRAGVEFDNARGVRVAFEVIATVYERRFERLAVTAIGSAARAARGRPSSTWWCAVTRRWSIGGAPRATSQVVPVVDLSTLQARATPTSVARRGDGARSPECARRGRARPKRSSSCRRDRLYRSRSMTRAGESHGGHARKLFGTDGIRGVANEHPMTSEVALKVGAAVTWWASRGGRPARVVIGKDTRLSGYMFETALAAGVCSQGGRVMLTGPLPTPAIAYIVQSMRADAGVVISASHNPYADNGIKLFGPDGFKLPDAAEAEIEALMDDPRLVTARRTEAASGARRRSKTRAGATSPS